MLCTEVLKERLVAFVNHQDEGIDYHKTFAPVAKMVTVHVYLATATVKDYITSDGCAYIMPHSGLPVIL